MARQNQKNIRKNQEGTVVRNKKPIDSNFFSESNNNNVKKESKKVNKVVKKQSNVNLKNDTGFEKVNDEHIVTSLGQKVKILKDISTVDTSFKIFTFCSK